MKRHIILAAIGLAAILAMGADDSCSVEDGQPAQKANGGSPGPAAEVDLNCDYLLGSGTNDYSFVAGGDVRNTGDVPVAVRVKAKWSRLGSDPVTSTKTINLPVGRAKEVQISVPASFEDIDAHQSADGKCSVVGRIVG